MDQLNFPYQVLSQFLNQNVQFTRPPNPEEVLVWIPSYYNQSTGEFSPLLNISSTMISESLHDGINLKPFQITPHKGGARVTQWRPQEDQLAMDYVREVGPQNWTQLAKLVNERFHGGREVRLGKHCRERWYNHLDPSLKSNS